MKTNGLCDLQRDFVAQPLILADSPSGDVGLNCGGNLVAPE